MPLDADDCEKVVLGLAILRIGTISKSSPRAPRPLSVIPVAEAIASRGIPFLFASGYVDLAMPLALKDRPLLRKPFQLDELDRAIKEMWILRP